MACDGESPCELAVSVWVCRYGWAEVCGGVGVWSVGVGGCAHVCVCGAGELGAAIPQERPEAGPGSVRGGCGRGRGAGWVHLGVTEQRGGVVPCSCVHVRLPRACDQAEEIDGGSERLGEVPSHRALKWEVLSAEASCWRIEAPWAKRS